MKTSITLPRQQSLAMPDVANPFVHRLHLGPLEILQVCNSGIPDRDLSPLVQL